MPYCSSCGSEVNEKAIVCVKCGVGIPKSSTNTLREAKDPDAKDWLTTMLLCFFLGYFGIHRFYTGHIGIGIIQLLTFGGCGIWTLIDLIIIVTGKYKDADGLFLVK